MSYQHLNTFEGARIETLANEGFSLRQIVIKVGRDVSTISRELKRNSSKSAYIPEAAPEEYNSRRKRCSRKSKWSLRLAATINEKLELTWWPEQIPSRLFSETLCFKTLYRWIYSGLLLHSNNLTVLRHKGKRRHPRETRGRFNVEVSIHKRPKEVRERQTFGHWELDSVVSSRGKSKGCPATFVERKTRWYAAIKMSDRSAGSMEVAIHQRHQALPVGSMQTATVDRGSGERLRTTDMLRRSLLFLATW
jgi:IS30 family transposase